MKLLLLAGTQEARKIAVALSREGFLNLTVSLPQPERQPQSYGWPLRIGGWGSEDAFRAYLKREGFDGVLDVTHPFAVGMSERAARVSRAMGLAYLQFLRPAWIPDDGDRWTFLNDESEAEKHIPPNETVFLATGRRALDKLSGLSDRKVYCRIRDRADHSYPYPNGTYLLQPGPFTVMEERRLFQRLGVTWLVTRNSGGQGSWPKIEAARELGLPVAMVRRPRQPEGSKISTVAEALAWVRRRL